jgi:hypothetical protein
LTVAVPPEAGRWLKAQWRATENHRRAKYYGLTGRRQLERHPAMDFQPQQGRGRTWMTISGR